MLNGISNGERSDDWLLLVRVEAVIEVRLFGQARRVELPQGVGFL
ncbi:uncharacterized protein METZ01_LOCUS505287, partial [marine metagenome]